MAYLLQIEQTEDTYSPSNSQNTITVEGSRVWLQVFNAAIYVRFQDFGLNRAGSGSYGSEILLPPGNYQMHRHTLGVQVRSAVAGQPAMVILEVT